MSVVLTESLFREVLEQLSEVYAGPFEAYPWFIDPSPNSGLLGTLGNLTAREASKPITKGGYHYCRAHRTPALEFGAC